MPRVRVDQLRDGGWEVTGSDPRLVFRSRSLVEVIAGILEREEATPREALGHLLPDLAAAAEEARQLHDEGLAAEGVPVDAPAPGRR